MRQRYIEELKFLPEQYEPNSIYVLSTDVNRTIMSAYAQLLGLYPLGTGPSLNSPLEVEHAVPAFPVKQEVVL